MLEVHEVRLVTPLEVGQELAVSSKYTFGLMPSSLWITAPRMGRPSLGSLNFEKTCKPGDRGSISTTFSTVNFSPINCPARL